MVTIAKPKPIRIPRYCLHKSTGRAYATIDGREIYFGPYRLKADGSPDSPEYHKLIAARIENGGRTPIPKPIADDAAPRPFTVIELVDQFWQYVERRYKNPDGSASSEAEAYRQALRPLRRLFGETAAAEFGPKRLRVVREEMKAAGWCRSNINRQLHRVRRCFKWGVSEELLAGGAYDALRTVEAIRRGPEVRESEPIKPIAEDRVAAVLPLVSDAVAAMIKLQSLTGMRPGEVVIMRTCDLEMDGEKWTYQPARHKTAHHGIIRKIAMGAQARELLRPWLRPGKLNACLFNPAESADGYTAGSYRRAIARACDMAFPLPANLQEKYKAVRKWVDKETYTRGGKAPTLKEYPTDLRKHHEEVEAFRTANRWHPNQLRHNVATKLEKKFGRENTRGVLGHTSVKTTEGYIERDLDRSRQIMEEVG